SSLGMPLLNGFIGEFTILRGVFEVNKTWAAWGVIGIILGAAYLPWLYQRVMFGPVTNPANEHLPDLNLREQATLMPLVLLALWIGVYPKPLFRYLDVPVRQIVERVNPRYYQPAERGTAPREDRKSTRLNSSHGSISYAVFCLKKKIKNVSEDDMSEH